MASSEQPNTAAKKATQGAPARGPGPLVFDAGARRRRIWRGWLIGVAGIAAAAGGGLLWVRQAELARLRASLPPMPDVASRPAALGTALREAEQKARSSRAAFEGVADIGRLYHANGYNAEAAACWRILHAEQPREARWAYYLADLSRTAGNDADMVSLLEETVKLAPTYAPAWLKLAEWEFKTGRLDAAERDYRRRLGLLPGDSYATFGLARVARQRDQRDESRRLFEQIIVAVPAFAPAHNLYAELLDEGGDADGAKMQRFLGHIAGIGGRFRDADDPWLEELREWCYDTSRLALWASIEDSTNHGDHGVALLERALRIAPDDPRGHTELGRVYLRSGNAAKALALFEQGKRLPNAPSDLFAGLSEAYRDLKQFDKALQAAEQGLVLMPDAANLQTARGTALQAAGRLEEAVEAYRLAVKGASHVCETHFNLGNALLQLGRKEEAYVSLKRALELQPTFPQALVVLGQSELEAGQLDSAAQYLRPLYEFNPGTVAARRLMTRWYLLAGMTAARDNRAAEAESDLRAGLAIDPDAADLRARLGLFYAQQRRFTEALEQLEAYHHLQPAEPMASLFLGQVYADLGRTDDARRVLTEGEQLASQAGDSTTATHCRAALAQLPK